MAQLVVVGAGIAGLSAARRLRELGHDVLVLDGADAVGGKLRQARVADRLIDVGAESVLWRRPEAPELFAALSAPVAHPAGRAAAVWSRGALHPLPTGTLMGIPGRPEEAEGLLTTGEVARATAERRVELDGDASLGELIARALGDAVVDRLVEPLLGGVYAGQARLLSAAACLPQVRQAAAQGSSLLQLAQAAAAAGAGRPEPVFGTLPGGLGRLPGLLARELLDVGADVRTGAMVRALDRAVDGWRLTVGPTRAAEHIPADGVVLATPAAPTARLLSQVAAPAADALAEIEYASMAIVTYAFPADRVPAVLRERSGFLVPPIDQRSIKAATFSSAKWPWLAQREPDLWFTRVSLGRHREEAALQRSDADLVAAGLADLAAAVGEPLPRPIDAHVQRWGGGLPQYAVGHLDRVARVRQTLAQVPGLDVAGAAYEGVGIPACIGSGADAAERLHETLL